MLANHTGRKYFCLATLIVLIYLPSLMSAGTLFFSFDEWGKGFLCSATTSSPTVPLCSVNPTTHLGSFARIPSGFTSDPTPGGGSRVLTYRLPFSVSGFDVFMQASNESGPGDLIRGIGNTLLFYSLQEPTGTNDCTTMTPRATGCDGVADVRTLPSARPGAVTIGENGPEGDNHGLFFGTSIPGGDSVEFIPHSDELIACPPISNCGPFNIAPPANNPFRDVTGLPGVIAPVMLPADNPRDPIATAVPEPGSIWLLLGGCAIFFKKSHYNRKQL